MSGLYFLSLTASVESQILSVYMFFACRTNIRKYKEWLDAEYTVTAIDADHIRLAVNGVYEERLACTNVYFEHKGMLWEDFILGDQETENLLMPFVTP